MRNEIQQLIEQILPVCEGWVKMAEDGFDRFVDPNDGEEISAHYGATHAAASFIIWGKVSDNETLYNKGVSLLNSILQRWSKNKLLYAFHFDFNNFALCLVEDLVDTKIRDLIRKTVIHTSDSRHNTINWLPMRWAVNRKRAEWTFDNKYQRIINRCKNIITKATNADGGIEDRLPNGISFNLQYDLATVAVLQYMNVQGENLDLSKQLGFLLNAVAPDGDINYQGRGTNQIFAWGLWIYLLSSSGQKEALTLALHYLSPRLSKMLEHNNIMLNEWDGTEKYLWWDYHYASVYTAHCMLWLILAYIDYGKKTITPTYPLSAETGLQIYRSQNFFVSWFEGRSEYFAEMGPAIAAIWTKKKGMIFKGTFGPWQGSFGNRYIYEDIVIKNFCGVIAVKRNVDYSKKSLFHRLFPTIQSHPQVTYKPVFKPVSVSEKNNILSINFSDIFCYGFLGLPLLSEADVDVFINSKRTDFNCNSAFRNQYNWVKAFQTKCCQINKLELKIYL